MLKNYILIDYENVQPKNMEIILNHTPFRVYIFVGELQKSIPFDIAETMQKFGENAKYIKISGNGKNALDFHLVYYLGRLTKIDTQGHYHIISKDGGFDPLIQHIRDNKMKIARYNDLAKIPLLQKRNAEKTTKNPPTNTTHPSSPRLRQADTAEQQAKNLEEKIKKVLSNLQKRTQGKPATTATLSATINAIFGKKLTADEVSAIVKHLQAKKLISTNVHGKLSYHL